MKKKSKVPASVPFEDLLNKHLRDSSDEELGEYLTACFNAGDNMEAFYAAVQDLTRARGGVKKLADDMGTTRDSLYKAFKNKSQMIETFAGMIDGLGYEISFTPKGKSRLKACR